MPLPSGELQGLKLPHRKEQVPRWSGCIGSQAESDCLVKYDQFLWELFTGPQLQIQQTTHLETEAEGVCLLHSLPIPLHPLPPPTAH